MYTLYTDKGEDFKCNIGVEGAKISNTQARLVLKSDNINLLFEGKVSSDGTCTIPIKRLKDVLEEGTKGDIKLEVIAEDTFFTPWEDKFEVKTNKKVTVEVANDTSKSPIKESKVNIKVDIPTPTKQPVQKTEKNHGKILSELLVKHGVTLKNLPKNTLKVNNITEKYIKKFGVKEDPQHLIEQILKYLT